jgi:hypothetical protein
LFMRTCVDPEILSPCVGAAAVPTEMPVRRARLAPDKERQRSPDALQQDLGIQFAKALVVTCFRRIRNQWARPPSGASILDDFARRRGRAGSPSGGSVAPKSPRAPRQQDTKNAPSRPSLVRPSPRVDARPSVGPPTNGHHCRLRGGRHGTGWRRCSSRRRWGRSRCAFWGRSMPASRSKLHTSPTKPSENAHLRRDHERIRGHSPQTMEPFAVPPRAKATFTGPAAATDGYAALRPRRRGLPRRPGCIFWALAPAGVHFQEARWQQAHRKCTAACWRRDRGRARRRPQHPEDVLVTQRTFR